MPDTSAIGYIVVGLTQLLTLVLLYKKITATSERRDITPQPFRVREDEHPDKKFAARGHDHPDLLTKTEHEKLCRVRGDEITRIERSMAGVSKSLRAIESAAENRARRLHERIDNIVTPLNQLIGKVENQSEAIRKGGRHD